MVKFLKKFVDKRRIEFYFVIGYFFVIVVTVMAFDGDLLVTEH